MINLNWKEIQVHTTHEAMESVSNILNECGANGVVIKDSKDLTKDKVPLFGEIYELNPDKFPNEGVYIKAYFIDDEQLDRKVQEIKHKIEQLRQYGIDIGKNNIALKTIAEDDWETSWKKYYKPTQITEKITIVPSWEQYDVKRNDELIIKLDPGMAFGTGTHPTTILSVKALETHLKEDDIVIDVGCGSGILSFASILLGAEHVHAFDLDQVAINSTIINSDINECAEQITTKQNNLLNGVNVKANVIVSNILAEILTDLIRDVNKNLNENGILILSGIIEKKENDIKNDLETNGFKIIERNQMDHWVSFVAQKE